MKSKVIASVAAVLAVCLAVVFTHKAKAQTGAEDEVQKLRIELTKAQRELAELREMPIKLGRRKAVLGSGFVLQIESFSMKTMPLKITLSNQTFGQKVFDVVMDPAHVTPTTKEIGHAEGWAISPGDAIEIRSEGFTPIRKKVE